MLGGERILKINKKIIPRKHRKQVLHLVENFRKLVAENKEAFSDWNKFLLWMFRGANDGWLITNNKEYKALLWLLEIKDLMNYLDELESDSNEKTVGRDKAICWA